ncbi:RHS repeat-associated core domain-containing protein [Fibrobacter sp. UWH9]|uniref:RHS repeat domain-containing protein n=1 Tax=Fibrobacter sp. UWH9 TaxID=1896213 RepID=UPI000920A8DB|nr:RHS repeat-associated core domain-containing protein [Fibrobacter sp. UWH9]SHH92619.1 RHS repeat-associated core domain-containing protein [Fibrobacter sp. UWH9]
MESKSGNVLENTRSCSRGDSLMLTMAYDGSGRRVSKTRFRKACISDKSADANSSDGVYAADWERELVTHYTGIGTEVRESFHNGTPSETKVVVNMPQGLGRYGVEDAEKPSSGNASFEWYLKNHLGSTMLVYGTQGSSNADVADLGEVKKAYDYRSFGEQIDLIADAGDKVTENFTGKEKDDETELNYFGARYLDPMLGLWISVDPARQFSSPYLYVGNGMNPISSIDPDGNAAIIEKNGNNVHAIVPVTYEGKLNDNRLHEAIQQVVADAFNHKIGKYNLTVDVVKYNPNIHKNVNNNITLTVGRGEMCSSYGGGSCAHLGALPGEASINIKDRHGIAHEFGHLLGLDEKYRAKYMEDGLPYKGYKGNLMGDGGFSLTESQVEEMWKAGTIRPENGYKANTIKEN